MAGPGSSISVDATETHAPVPEPGTLILFGAGPFAFAAGYRIRRRKANAA